MTNEPAVGRHRDVLLFSKVQTDAGFWLVALTKKVPFMVSVVCLIFHFKTTFWVNHWCDKIGHLRRIRTHLSFTIITVSLPTFDTLFCKFNNLTSFCAYLFYKHRLLAGFWGRKTARSAQRNCLSPIPCARRSNMHRCACDWHKSRCLFDLKSLLRRAVYKT